ncbi:MAG: pyridoxal 5'-phosphate synthase glutaminase subunit PdxT [Nanoarchaeota archaeon]|nr:pyridoxal 5'-phosphate synthase glutaminase subunit PdxT [Nanoarchaeota archaeon]MBU1004320.1 pyridoxal 5'-phosphate synthase glutaminase subunit PdxT [Nanoarchaeota archaeon]MBU1945462.1 pyridoxal 5'-phosphate synthase glutaminase subunit PdxT [Nanoarchaeota archaeon]
MKIGVLALQGSVKEHVEALKKCEVDVVLVKLPHDLDEINGLIIPGGESTTIGKLMKEYGLDKAIKFRYEQGMPIYGTCAGAILLAKEIVGSKQIKLGLMDISVKRNEYGRQVDSFEAELNIFDKPFRGIFIRAPVISGVHDGCKILSEFEGNPVFIEQKGRLLASTFHPELTKDLRVHKYFVDMVEKSRTMDLEKFILM